MKTDKSLADIFDINPIGTQSLPAPIVVQSDIDSDFEFARNNIRELAEKGKAAVDNILQVASATDHPRAYEVAANLLKSMSDINKDLIELQKKKRDLMPQKEQPQITVDKAVFIGSTSDLIKQIKQIG
jgi:ubiquinone biosynthesis protein Coq4